MALPAILGRLVTGAVGAAAGKGGSGNSSQAERPSVDTAVQKMGAVAPRRSASSLTVAKTSVTPSEAISDNPVKLLKSMVKMITKMSSGIEQQNRITLEQAKADREDRLEANPATGLQKALSSGVGSHTKKLGLFTLALGGLVMGAKETFDWVGDKLKEFGGKLLDILPDWLMPEASASEMPSQPSGGGTRRRRDSTFLDQVMGIGRKAVEPRSSATRGGRSSVPEGAKLGNVKRVIQQAESRGNPDALNGDRGATTGRKVFGRPLTSMTIREVYNSQQRFSKPGGGTGAAGLYQIIPKTLKELMEKHGKYHGLDWNDRFTAANQDKLADALLYGKRGIRDNMSENEVIDRLAMEWAGLPVSRSRRGHRRNVRAGQSYYAGTQGNKANVSVGQVRGALRRDRSAPRPRRRQTSSNDTRVPTSTPRRNMASLQGNKATPPLRVRTAQPTVQMAAATVPSQSTTLIQAPSNRPQDQTQIVTPNRSRSSDYSWYFGTDRKA